MYKWFVWSSMLNQYLPLPGLFPFSRGDCPAFIGFPFGVCFSIPMFGEHNAVK